MNWVKVYLEHNILYYDLRCSGVTYNNSLSHALSAVENIVETYSPPYTLMASGGVDSQAMIYAWLLTGVKFKVVSIKYFSNNIWFNDFDIENLLTYQAKYKFDLELKEFDILDFYNEKFYSIAEEYKCSSPQICSHIHNSSQLEGTVIQSGNFLGLNQVPLNYPILGLHRFQKQTKKDFIPYFFLHTPELAYSSYTAQIEQRKTALKIYEAKVLLYKSLDFDVIPSERSYSGFEKIKTYYNNEFSNRLTLKHKLLYNPNPSTNIFDILLRYPLSDKYDPDKIIFYKNIV